MKTLGNAALAVLLGVMFLLGGCAQKDNNGQATASSFSSTGMFNRIGGDAVRRNQ